jgi:hypothetical protein
VPDPIFSLSTKMSVVLFVIANIDENIGQYDFSREGAHLALDTHVERVLSFVSEVGKSFFEVSITRVTLSNKPPFRS